MGKERTRQHEETGMIRRRGKTIGEGEATDWLLVLEHIQHPCRAPCLQEKQAACLVHDITCGRVLICFLKTGVTFRYHGSHFLCLSSHVPPPLLSPASVPQVPTTLLSIQHLPRHCLPFLPSHPPPLHHTLSSPLPPIHTLSNSDGSIPSPTTPRHTTPTPK